MSFSIDDLIDDCLLLIFYQLSLGDRIKIRLTCNRWATLMPFDDIDSLDVDSLPFSEIQLLPAGLRDVNYHITKIRRSSILRAFDFILPRIGANLKSISLGTYKTDGGCEATQLLNNYHFDLIIQYCPQLEKLEIGINADMNHMDFGKLSIQLCQMASLHTISLSDYGLKQTQQILLANAFGNQTWPFLTDLTANCDCRRVIVAPQLKNLTLPCVKNVILSKWCEAYPNLPSLEMTGNILTDCSLIASLRQLTTLSLDNIKLDDDDLSLICSKCPKLTSVSLNLTRVTRFDYLLHIESLTALYIVVAENFHESNFEAVFRGGNLKNFHFYDDRRRARRTPLLTVVGLTNLVSFNPNLEVLTLKVLFLSDEAISTVLEVSKQLKTLVLYKTPISNDAFAAIGSCENLSKFQMTVYPGAEPAVSADHYRRLLDARLQNGLRNRLKVVVEDGFVQEQTEEKTFLKEQLKKVNIFLSYVR